MAVDNELPAKLDYNQDNNQKNITAQDTSIAVEIELEKYEINILESVENRDEHQQQSSDNEEEPEKNEDVVDVAVTTKPANTYAAKKTVAQGMMDIALITANANQLRYIIEFNRNSSTYYLNLILIIISLMLQMAVGVSLIFKGKYDLKGESKHVKAKRINNYVVVGIFLVTIINVFIASFTITGSGN